MTERNQLRNITMSTRKTEVKGGRATATDVNEERLSREMGL